VIGRALLARSARSSSSYFAFDKSNVQSLPIRHWTTHWFAVAFNDPAVRSALWLSVKAGLAATLIALILGTLVAFGIHRFRFFGRDTVSLMLVLPIALPGIVTGLALQSAFNSPTSTFRSTRSSWATPRSAWSWSSTTWSPACAARRRR
jgi:ABC-type spermidine/putrescine transport system permease subunit II